MTLDGLERLARRLGATVALAALTTTIPGVVRVVTRPGPTIGRPGLVFTPARFVLIGVAWFAGAAAAWKPLPLHLGSTARGVLAAVGLATYVSGMALAVAGRIALGAAYAPSSTLGLTLAPRPRLVTTGPFSIVRHPMYVGLAVASVGAVLLYRSWTTVLFVLQVPVLVLRARREEELLASVFGDKWRCYAATVPAWVPRLCRA